MNVPNVLYTPDGRIKRTVDSNHIVPEQTEIELINLPPTNQPYTLLHQTALNNYVITISFVSKVQDPTNKREHKQNHTFFLPLNKIMNDYVNKLRVHEGKEGTVNV